MTRDARANLNELVQLGRAVTMPPRFVDPVLAGGELTVSGPFETHGEVLDDVIIRFLIIGEVKPPATTPVQVIGTATLDHGALTTTTPDPTKPDVKNTTGDFSKTVAVSGLTVGDTVRGIGLAVSVKKAAPPDPPAFETFTWCVNLTVK